MSLGSRPEMPAPAASAGRRPGGGSSALVNGSVALIAVLLVVTFALRAASASPPGIAEFSPQAHKPISQAPNEQTSVFGSGQNGAAVGTPTPSPTATPPQAAPTLPAGNPPVVLQCIGNPPRQIEDPQSPPCVPSWSGNNGGSTSPGVTGNSITVVITNGAESNAARITNDLVK